jgi:hypothetical protein
MVQPLLDGPPPNPLQGKWRERVDAASRLQKLVTIGAKNRRSIVPFYELFTGACVAFSRFGLAVGDDPGFLCGYLDLDYSTCLTHIGSLV